MTTEQDVAFINIYKTLDLMADRIDRAILRSLIYSCNEVEDFAIATAPFNDDTTATRESIVCFIEDHDTTGKEDRSIMIAESLRQGSGIRTIEARESDIAGTGYTMVLTAGTYYTEHLETAFGGQYAFLEPTMNQFASRIADRTFRVIKRTFDRAGISQSASADADPAPDQ